MFARMTMMAVAPVLLFTGFPEAADAGSDPGIANAVLKVGAAALVSGIFICNHFKGSIRGLLGGILPRGRKGEAGGD